MGKKTDTTTEDTQAQTGTEEEAHANAEKKDSPPAPATTPAPGSATQHENTLLPLHELAQRHRVPTWMQASLARLMGWEDGKMVSDEEYQTALARLSGRRMGGQ